MPQQIAAHREADVRTPLRKVFDWSILQSARLLRHAVPLATRKRIVRWLGRKTWPGQCVFTIEFLRDFARQDAGAFHRFLWSHHLGYAQNFVIARRFGMSNLHVTRQMLLAELTAYLRARGIDPERDVQSVFDIGSSLGYLLRFVETELFPAATVLGGLDIDQYAVKTGAEYLGQLGSKVELAAGDVEELDRVMGSQAYDVVLCCATLTYLSEAEAARVVRTALGHTKVVLAMLGVAHSAVDNSLLHRSDTCEGEEAFVHNLDQMVANAGGRVAVRRWEGSKVFDGHTFYIVLAEPAAISLPVLEEKLSPATESVKA